MTIVFMMNAHRPTYKQLIKWLRDVGNRCLSEASNQGYRAQEDNDLRKEAQRRESSFVQQNQRRRHCCRSRCWVIVGSGSNLQRIIGLERHEERLHVIKQVIIKKIKIKRTRNQLKVGQVEEVWKIRV